MKAPISIYLASNYPLICRGLKHIFQEYQHFNYLGASSLLEDAKEQIAQLNPDVVLVDVEFDSMRGLQLIDDVRNSKAKSRFCVLTSDQNEQTFNEALSKGVQAYIPLNIYEKDLVHCLKQVNKGENYISPVFSSLLMNGRKRQNGEDKVLGRLMKLSKAEMRVIHELVKKKSNREIAASLFLSVKTVENHRNRMVKKLELQGNHHALLTWVIENKKQIQAYEIGQPQN